MKLNPNKCAFGVTAGKFLGFMVSQRGIEVNPEKVRAIMELEPPRTVKEVQSLNGKIAALNSSRTAIKGQAVADFIAEFTHGEGQLIEEKEQWNIYTDGSSNRRAGGAGVVIQTPQGDKIQCMIRLDFPTTNNEAEYEALVAGLDLAKAAGVENIIVHCDSQVVTSQINGDYECKNDRMKRYLEEVKYRISNLEVEFIQILREENEWADHLAKAASAEFMLVPEQVLSFVQISSLIDDGTNIQVVNSEYNWTTPLISYLKARVLPDEKGAARKLKVQASRFVLIKDVLYKRGFS
ncbi:uncharacterized protein LOC115954636 [Quercus lobata]|uniref:uncharacterized protein LOC115954636 n=1 Tax=Quercus lobata TaxID=97700 RepID=UPI00124677BA|nr:uncharacterized protein LOC115954636 [Quercus lobata]